MKISNLPFIVPLSLFVLSGCTSTKLSQTWSDPDNKTSYKDILVVAISDSEMTRRAYESFFVASLKQHGIDALQPDYYADDRTYTLESSLYDVRTEELVWTTRSRTFAPESVDQVVQEVSGLIIDDLISRKLIQ